MEPSRQSLLLLPDSAASYKELLRDCIQTLRRDEILKPHVFIIGLVLRRSVLAPDETRTIPWQMATGILGDIYTEVTIVCGELNVPAYANGGTGSIDIRVLLLKSDHSPSDYVSSSVTPDCPNYTVITELSSFVTRKQHFRYIFQPSAIGEQKEDDSKMEVMLRRIARSLSADQVIDTTAGYVPSSEAKPAGQAMPLRQTICLGGTFDHLHVGHKLLLSAAALLLDVPGDHDDDQALLIIGISGDELLTNKQDAHLVEDWHLRARNALEFVSFSLGSRFGGDEVEVHEEKDETSASFHKCRVVVQCVKIHDAYGPTTTRENIDKLVVSAETSAGGDAVNKKRQEKGWRELEIAVVQVLGLKQDVHDQSDGSEKATNSFDFSNKISSSAIRRQIAKEMDESQQSANG